MKIQEINVSCWEVTAPDGGGVKEEHVIFTETKKLADDYIKAYGNGSWPMNIRKFEFNKKIIIIEELHEVEELKMERLRASALAKLTNAEREALGL